ncbi:hypothetical protein [Streptomyces sp. NPDC059786]|uniref:hypothetical protein n=1 Tax=Streptomyces sp. NPDC059786 TaxID=3346946 RepID=UPI003659B0CD
MSPGDVRANPACSAAPGAGLTVTCIRSSGTGPDDNQQASRQAMIERHTTNWSVIDYIELPALGAGAGAL